MQAKGMTKHSGMRISYQKIIIRLTIVLTILAIIVASFVLITVVTANRMINTHRSEMSNIPSNILPQYSPTGFLSADGQTNLSGWFFRADQPQSTIILVHDTGANRMQFNIETVDMIDFFLAEGFNVFLFDQRNSGESGGATTGFGYIEWKDVIGAIDHVRRISVTSDVVLYGVGNGCSSAMLAVNYLPAPGEDVSSYPIEVRDLEFDRTYVSSLILDSPAKYSDDYIRPYVVREFSAGFLIQRFVPYAIRISTSEGSNMNMATEISRLSIPVCILYGDRDVFIGEDVIRQTIEERSRLHPNTTTSVRISGAGYTEGFIVDSDTYLDTVQLFLNNHY